MADKISIFESAHKGDYEIVTKKVEENPKLLTKTDEVNITNLLKTAVIVKNNVLERQDFVALGSNIWQLETGHVFSGPRFSYRRRR